MSCPLDHRGVEEAVGLAPTRACTPTCFRDRPLIWPDRFPERKGRDSHPHGLGTRTRVAGGLLIWPVPFHGGALGGSRTHDLVRTGDVLCLTELQGLGLAGTTRTCDPRLRRAVLSSTELRRAVASTAGVEPAPSGFVDRRLLHSTTSTRRCCAPPTGLAPATSGLTGRRYHWLSYGGMVRALGLEPSLVRGKSPVPYQSGVTRRVGREGIEPPVSEDGWSTASCTPWRVRPVFGARWRWPRRRCLCSCQCAGVPTGCRARRSRLGRSRTSGRRFWRPRHRRGSSPGWRVRA